MRVYELIELLKQQNQDAEVKVSIYAGLGSPAGLPFDLDGVRGKGGNRGLDVWLDVDMHTPVAHWRSLVQALKELHRLNTEPNPIRDELKSLGRITIEEAGRPE